MTHDTYIVIAYVLVGLLIVMQIVDFIRCRESQDNPEVVGKFEKVSFGQFKKDWLDTFFPNFEELGTDFKASIMREIDEIYTRLTIPQRATMFSAGHDFYAPSDFTLEPGETVKIPTGIRCSMSGNWVLKIYPRSSLGFKYRMQLNNSVGIIDSDFYYADNEGHIFAKITNDTNENKTINLKQGDAFVQGIFVQYGITENDNVTTVRTGGIGSTNK